MPRLLHDWGWDHRVQEEGIADTVWAHLKDSVCMIYKGPRPKLSRWMSVVDCIAWHDEHSTTRLISFLHTGLQHGWAPRGEHPLLKALTPTTEKPDQKPAKQQVARGEDVVNQTFKSSKNGILVCSWVIVDESHQAKNRAILTFLSLVRK